MSARVDVVMRNIHRILGYLTIGLVLAYSISGIALIYRTTDFLKVEKNVEVALAPGLSAEELGAELKMRGFAAKEETEEAIYFSNGEYSKLTGVAVYSKKEVAWPINKFIDLHKLPSAKSTGIAVVTTIFGVCLLLLALTSLFMYRPSSKRFAANMLYTILGVALAIVLLICL